MNGIKTDPSEKPVFEPREITLSGWVEGDSWEQMKENFNAVMIDLTKAGTQRLICDAYGKKTIVCDVKLKDGFPLLEGKTKEGKNIGVFTLKLVEENPIKKILYTESSNLQLSFLSPKMVTVNIDGKAQQVKGNVVINKTLSIRPYNKIQIGGRNLFLNSKNPRVYTNRAPASIMTGLELNTEYTVSFTAQNFWSAAALHIEFDGGIGKSEFALTGSLKRFSVTMKTNNVTGDLYLWLIDGDGSVELREIKVEKGNKATDWTPAPEDQHYISISGNIDEITNLNTNAAVLWEILL
ncbi:galactose-binding protein [Elizabethkingia anophelis]|nr:galactose-binding protein [Elizabethkingia anophelis]